MKTFTSYNQILTSEEESCTLCSIWILIFEVQTVYPYGFIDTTFVVLIRSTFILGFQLSNEDVVYVYLCTHTIGSITVLH